MCVMLHKKQIHGVHCFVKIQKNAHKIKSQVRIMCEQDFQGTYPKCVPKKEGKEKKGWKDTCQALLTTPEKTLAEGCCLLKPFLNSL